MSDVSVKVLGFAGSLRQGSLNRMLLRAAAELAPAGMTIETFDLSEIPHRAAETRSRLTGPPRSDPPSIGTLAAGPSSRLSPPATVERRAA